MMRPARLVGSGFVLLAVIAVLGTGCTKKKQDDKAKPKDGAGASAKVTAPAKPALKASEDDCVGPLERSKNPREIAFGDWKFKLDGYLLTQLTKDPDEEIVVY